MILGSIQKIVQRPAICVSSNIYCFKLLIANNLRCDAHVDALCAKVASRLYFLKCPERPDLWMKYLLCFYKCVNYKCVTLPVIRLRCMAPQDVIIPRKYSFFKHICHPENCLQHLLPLALSHSLLYTVYNSQHNWILFMHSIVAKKRKS